MISARSTYINNVCVFYIIVLLYYISHVYHNFDHFRYILSCVMLDVPRAVSMVYFWSGVTGKTHGVYPKYVLVSEGSPIRQSPGSFKEYILHDIILVYFYRSNSLKTS